MSSTRSSTAPAPSQGAVGFKEDQLALRLKAAVSDPKLLPRLLDALLQRWPAAALLESVDWKQA